MKRFARFGIVIVVLVIAPLVYLRIANGNEPAVDDESMVETRARAELHDAEGRTVGHVDLVSTGRGVGIEAEVEGLPAGRHGFHVHEVGLCEPHDFTSAGGHFNPSGREHGMENPKGPHAGDLPNIIVGEDGRGSLSLVNPYLSLGTGTADDLLDGEGTTIMIHAGPDDYFTDPAGDSGARIACGVIVPIP